MGPYSREGDPLEPKATGLYWQTCISLGALLLLCGVYSAFSRDPDSLAPNLKLWGCQQLGPLTQDSHSKQQGRMSQAFQARLSGFFKLRPCLTRYLVFSLDTLCAHSWERLGGSRLAFLPTSAPDLSHLSHVFHSLDLTYQELVLWLSILKNSYLSYSHFRIKKISNW